MKTLITIVLSTMLIKSTTSISCNAEENQDKRRALITCFNLTSPLDIQFNYTDTSKFKKVLLIVDSNISRLPPKGFWRFPTINELWLTGNQIQELGTQVFDGLLNVEQISIDKNKLTEIPEGVFTSDLEQLERLNMEKNNIEKVSKNLFKEITSLKYLHLNFNKIAKLEMETFRVLTTLTSLELNHNLLTEFIDYKLFGNSASDEKNLSHSLEYLNLGNNRITSFVVKNLKQLKQINLTSNNLSYLEPDSFAGLSELENLDLSSNFIKKIPAQLLKGSFKWQGFESNLRSLDLSKNLINTFYISSKNLQMISLAYNKISCIKPGTFRDLQFLSTINLSHNKIRRIPFGVFQNLINLQNLNLSHNRLKKFNHHLLSGKTNPNYLDLSNNKINSFRIEKLKEHLTNLLSISLVNNSFTCDTLAQLAYQLPNLNVTFVKGSSFDVQNIGGIACDGDEDY